MRNESLNMTSGWRSMENAFDLMWNPLSLALSLNKKKYHIRSKKKLDWKNDFQCSNFIVIKIKYKYFSQSTVVTSPPPPLYIITPTYRRPEQIAEITRLGYTLKHIPNLFWLVIEDATVPTALVTRQLKRIGVPFEHLIGKLQRLVVGRIVRKKFTASGRHFFLKR